MINTYKLAYINLVVEVGDYYVYNKSPVFPLRSYEKLMYMISTLPYNRKFKRKIELIEFMLQDDLPRLKEQKRINTINKILK
jgi:hypothetical protein